MNYLDIVLSKLKDFVSQQRIYFLLNAYDSNRNTALHIATKNGDETFFKTLINNGALSTIPYKDGLTPDEIMNQHHKETLRSRANTDHDNRKKNL